MIISIYKMNYRTDIFNFFGGRGAYFENFHFGGALFREGRSLERGAYPRVGTH